MAPYSSARATAKATDVTGPGVLAGEQLVDRRGRRGAVPTANTKPPETGCESADTTRKVTV